MITHMQHPDNPARTLCGWAIDPDRANSPVVPLGSKGANCGECRRLCNFGQKVVDI